VRDPDLKFDVHLPHLHISYTAVSQSVPCHEINSSTNRFCSKCGSPLDVRTALEVQKEQETTDQIMNKLFENPKFRNAVEKTLKVLK
jgi:hypothetical protein